MKRIIIPTIWMLLITFSISVQAQSSIDRYYEQYTEDERFSRVSVSSKMFSMFMDLDLDDPTEQELAETISKLKGLKMLMGEKVDNAKSIYAEAVSGPESRMDELMTISDAAKEFRFFITEANGTISELLMMGYENDRVLMMSLVGDIDLKAISALSQKLDIDGFEHFKDVHK